jgi:hypothetical protein
VLLIDAVCHLGQQELLLILRRESRDFSSVEKRDLLEREVGEPVVPLWEVLLALLAQAEHKVRPSRSLALLSRHDETIALKHRQVLANSHARSAKAAATPSTVVLPLLRYPNLFFSGLQNETFYWLSR